MTCADVAPADNAEDVRHRLEERAAIREFDGRQCREDAERGAHEELRGARL